jgi:hypothetical protein
MMAVDDKQVRRVRRSVPLPPAWKRSILAMDLPRQVWTSIRSRQLQNEYERRREYYAEEAAHRRLVYSETSTIREVRARLAARGYTPPKRHRGEVHTFACIPRFGWHEHLLPDLEALGPVTHFDYVRLGFSVEDLDSVSVSAQKHRKEMLALLLPALREAHAKRPVDWIFCYGGGQDTSPPLLRQIAEELGIPAVNMSLDDKQGWAGGRVGEWRTGAVDITAEFDLYLTSARVACEWHMVAGGRAVYMPEGFNRAAYYPLQAEQDIPVSFIGAAYGFRTSVVSFLRRNGIDIHPFGPGWRTRAAWGEEQVAIINRSRINLGMGGIEYSESLTNVKTRDFEIPGTGGGAYLTSFNPDLAEHFVVGKEILCYRNRDEMLELLRYYLSRPDEAREVSRSGRARCLLEHRWLHRYERALRILSILDP